MAYKRGTKRKAEEAGLSRTGLGDEGYLLDKDGAYRFLNPKPITDKICQGVECVRKKAKEVHEIAKNVYYCGPDR